MLRRFIDSVEERAEKLEEQVRDIGEKLNELEVEVNEKADDYDVRCEISDLENRVDTFEISKNI